MNNVDLIEISLDGDNNRKIVEIIQGDYQSRTIEVSFLNNGEKLIIDDSYDVRITFRNLEDVLYAYESTQQNNIFTFGDNLIIEIPYEISKDYGRVKAELSLYKDGAKLTSETFIIKVNSSIGNNSAWVDEKKFDILKENIKKVEDIVENIGEAAEKAEHASQQADEALDKISNVDSTLQSVEDAIERANDTTNEIINLKNSGAFNGDDGYTPIKGVDYFDGYTPVKGVDYNDGKDGYTPIKGVDYHDGYTPVKGVDYRDGKDGYTPIKGVDYHDGYTPVKGVDYNDGADGYTPVKGVDYHDGYTPIKGTDYNDGVSPIVQIIEGEREHTVNITDINGTKSFIVADGSDYDDTSLQKTIALYNRRITNIEYANKGILYREDINEDESYVKDIANDIMPYGLLDSVCGKSLVYNSLDCDTTNSRGEKTNTLSLYGVRLDFVKDNNVPTVTLNGTSTSKGNLWFAFGVHKERAFDGHKYYVRIKTNRPDTNIICRVCKQELQISTPETVFTNADTRGDELGFYITLQLQTDVTYENAQYSAFAIDLTQMFGSGNEPTLIQCQQIFNANSYRYSDGELISKEFTEVISKGRNLMQISDLYPKMTDIEVDGDEVRFKPDSWYSSGIPVNFDSSRKISISAKIKNITGSNFGFRIKYKDGSFQEQKRSGNTISDEWIPIVINSYLKPISEICVNYSEKGIFAIKDFMVEYSDVGTEYVPYFESKTSLQPIISKYFPNGMCSAGSVCDVLDIENGVAIQNIGVVDLGSLSGWYMNSSNTAYMTPSVDIANFKTVPNSAIANIIHPIYITTSANSASNTNGSISCINTNTLRVGINDKLPSGIMYYEFAEPIVTQIEQDDIEALRTLHVEAGGTLTFANDNKYLNIPCKNKESLLIKTGGII